MRSSSGPMIRTLRQLVGASKRSVEIGDLVSGRHQGQQPSRCMNRPNIRPYPTTLSHFNALPIERRPHKTSCRWTDSTAT